MTKELVVLLNITLFLIQLILFILLLNRYIKELNRVRDTLKKEITIMSNTYNDNITFLSNELKYSFNLIEKELLDNQKIIKKELNRCKNIIDNFRGKNIIKKMIFQTINLKEIFLDLKDTLIKINMNINLDITNDYYIKGDYTLLKEAFLIILKYYYKNNININIKKYGKYINVEFISNCISQSITTDTVINYITEIISKHKGVIKIQDKDNLRISIVILPIEKKS